MVNYEESDGLGGKGWLLKEMRFILELRKMF